MVVGSHSSCEYKSNKFSSYLQTNADVYGFVISKCLYIKREVFSAAMMRSLSKVNPRNLFVNDMNDRNFHSGRV